jgi:hypothetical protein
MGLASVSDISGPPRGAVLPGVLAGIFGGARWVVEAVILIVFGSIGWLAGTIWLAVDFGFRSAADLPQRVPDQDEPSPED